MVEHNRSIDEELELSDIQIERNDEIYNAVLDLCKILAEDWNLEWDMAILGPIADTAASVLVERGIPVRFPSIVEDDNGRKYIEEYVDGLTREEG